MRELIVSRFARDALRGGVFIDAYAPRPYFFHLALIEAARRADPNFDALRTDEPLEYRLVGLRQEEADRSKNARLSICSYFAALVAFRSQFAHLLAACQSSASLDANFALDSVARPIAERHRASLLDSLPERERFIGRLPLRGRHIARNA